MPICHSHKFIFIHIPKCAGSSVRAALMSAQLKRIDFELVERLKSQPGLLNGDMLVKMDFDGAATPQQKKRLKTHWLHHMTANQLRGEVTPALWKEYFKFTVVRNPWDLLVSFYHFHKERTRSAEFCTARPAVAEKFREDVSFEEWVRTGIRVRPCSAFVTDETGDLLVDCIARFETLERDFGKICKHLWIDASLPHLRKSERSDYRRYYNVELRDLVAEKFASDIERFNYHF